MARQHAWTAVAGAIGALVGVAIALAGIGDRFWLTQEKAEAIKTATTESAGRIESLDARLTLIETGQKESRAGIEEMKVRQERMETKLDILLARTPR